MLQILRDRAQGWIAGIIIGVICFSFALWGVENYLGHGDSSDVVAKVNGVKISSNQVSASYERLRQEYMQQAGMNTPITTAIQETLRQQALRQLIAQQVLAQATVNHHYQISNEQMRQAIMQIPAFQVNGKFSPERFQQILNNLLYTEQGFLDGMRQTLMISQLERGITASNFAMPYEVDTAIKLTQQTRDIGYMILSAQQFYPAIQVSDAEIKNYYDQHQQDFKTLEQVSASYVQISPHRIEHTAKPSASELENFYQNNIQQFAQPEQWQVDRVLVKLPPDATTKAVSDAEKQINKLAARFKEANAIAISGQDTKSMLAIRSEWLTQGKQDPEFERVVSNLKPGQLSEPFRTAQGYNIVKLDTVKKAAILPYSQVEAKVKAAWQQQKVQQTFAAEVDKLTELTYTNPDSLSIAAKTLNVPVQTTELFAQTGGKNEFTKNAKIIAAAFSNEVLEQGVNSNPIELKDGSVVVLRVKDHQPSKVLPIADVKNQIVQILKQQKAQEQLEALGNKIITDIKNGQSPEKVAKDNKVSWQVKKDISRKTNEINVQIVQVAFSLPAATTAQPSVMSVELANNQLAIVSVSRITDGNVSKADAAQRTMIQTDLQTLFGQTDYNLYGQSLMQKAKVEKK